MRLQQYTMPLGFTLIHVNSLQTIIKQLYIFICGTCIKIIYYFDEHVEYYIIPTDKYYNRYDYKPHCHSFKFLVYIFMYAGDKVMNNLNKNRVLYK